EIIEASLKGWKIITEKIPKDTLISTTKTTLGYWINLLSTPYGTPFDINCLILPPAIKRSLERGTALKTDQHQRTFAIRISFDDTEEFMKMRISGCKAIGILTLACPEHEPFYGAINSLLDSNYASHIQVGGLLIEEIFKLQEDLPKKIFKLPEQLYLKLLNAKEKNYSELEQLHNTLQQDISTLIEFYK